MPFQTPGGRESRKGEHSAADDGRGNGAIVAMSECLCKFTSSMTEIGACRAFVAEGGRDSHKGEDCVADESHGNGAIVAVLDGIA